jgi:hypothetical protein
MHGIDQTKSFFDAAGPQAAVDVGCDVNQPATGRDFEPEFFAVGFQGKRIEQKVTKATKEKLPELNRFVTFLVIRKTQRTRRKGRSRKDKA